MLALDKATKQQREAFAKAKRSENQYGAALRKLARHIGSMVSGFDPNNFEQMLALQIMLERYAITLDPWAKSVARRMLAEVARRDERAWRTVAVEMGKGITQEIQAAPTGARMQALMNEQVTLIKSLPLEAAQRVHKLAIQGLQEGTRAKEIAAEIMRTGEVTRSRATLIARTEVGRASTALTQARAEFIGSEAYIWRTARDSRVRPSHKAMEGKVVKWNEPPTLDGMKGHAASLPNCRCFCEPIIPRHFFAEAAE